MWSTRPCATSAWPASRPARPAASTTGGSCRGKTPTASRRSSAGTRCRPNSSADELSAAGVSALDAPAEAAPLPVRRGRRRGRLRRRRQRRRRSALVGRAPLHEPLRAARGGEIRHRDGRRQRAGDASRPGLRHPPHRARFRRDAVSGARGPVDRNRPARRSTPRAARTIRASIRSRARATANGPATTTSR